MRSSRFTVIFNQLLHGSLQSSVTHFYRYIGYYLIDRTTNNNTWDIRKQTLGYIMFLRRKQSRKVKAKRCAKGRHNQKCNQEMESSSYIVPSYAPVGSFLTNNVMDYNFNYKLRSVIGREDNFTTNKRELFDTQVCATLLWIWMISQALVEYINIGRSIGDIP